MSRMFWAKGLCLFPKNPAHYFADLAMIENEEVVRPTFVNCTTGDPKNILKMCSS